MSTTGNELVVGDCYMYKGKNMGKFLQFKLVGNINDPDEEYTFENGILNDFLQTKKVFTKIQCSGGARRSKKSGFSRRKTRRVKKRTIKRR